MVQLSLFSDGQSQKLLVPQASGPGQFAPFDFYATFDVDSLCSYIPQDTAVLLPASSWARKGLKPPHLPPGIHKCGADSGGFVASHIWGEYRYTLSQYVAWLCSWNPLWAATMDYCCEPELAVVTKERQARTTQNAYAAWKTYRHVPFAWVPTIQGLWPEDYRRHAKEMKPLLEEMQEAYQDYPHWRVGIGTLCRREDVTIVQAILQAVREVLPGIPFHLWGIKLDALRSIDLTQVISTDSAVWHGKYGSARQQTQQEAVKQGMSVRRYAVLVNLPTYTSKVQSAVEESRRVMRQQHDNAILQQARCLLHRFGWTLDVATRRNRTYAYAVRRNGKRRERRYLCAVSRLSAWLTVQQCSALFPARLIEEQEDKQTWQDGMLPNNYQPKEEGL